MAEACHEMEVIYLSDSVGKGGLQESGHGAGVCVRPRILMSMDANDPELLVDLRAALRDDNPLSFLLFASTLAAVLRPPVNPIDRSEPEVRLEQVVHMMLETHKAPTDALLLVWAEMLDDEQLRQQVEQIVVPRAKLVPSWIRQIDRVRPQKAMTTVGGLGDVQTVLVESAGPDFHFTILSGICFLGMPFLEDGFAIPASLAEILPQFDEALVLGQSTRDLSLADARAALDELLDSTDHMYPPVDTETWPGVRALLEWQLRLMPDGGSTFERPHWSEAEQDSLAARFMKSTWAAGLDSEAGDRAGLLIDFACNYGPGDPRLWSPALVERVLLDLIPRKVMADPEYLSGFPETLMALIEFSHRDLKIDPELTKLTKSAAEDASDEYAKRISDGVEGSSVDLLRQLGLTPDMVANAVDSGDMSLIDSLLSGGRDLFGGSTMLEFITRQVGGAEALENLDDIPLPIEPFDLDGIEDDICERVQQISGIVAGACDGFFKDPEMRTAAFRILRRVAVADPSIFRRRSSDQTAAAAICYITGYNDAWFQQSDPSRTVKALVKWLGVKGSPQSRAETMMNALEPEDWYSVHPSLGDPSLLTSRRRRDLMDIRDGDFEAR